MVTLAALCAGAPGHALASGSQESLLQDDDILISAPTDAAVDDAFEELRNLGVDRVRLSVIWNELAPKRPDGPLNEPRSYPERQFDPLDRAVRSAERFGIKVLLNVRGPAPGWAEQHPVPPLLAGRGSYRPDPGAFGAFVEMVGRRYTGDHKDENGPYRLPRVSAWSIWNEPNWGTLLRPQTVRDPKTRRLRTVSPELYRLLFRAASAGLAASGHRDDIVLLGETSPIGSDKMGERSPMDPRRFLRDLFCLDTKLRPLRRKRAQRLRCDYDQHGPLAATGYAHHPYPVTAAPAAPSADKGWITLADTPRLVALLDAAARAGRISPGMPIWFTEFGYQTAPPDPLRGISLAQHAAWLVEAEYLAWREPRVAAFSQFLLRDDEPKAEYPVTDARYWGTYQTGLRFADGTVKPAYDAYRLPLLVAPGDPLELWGMVRPAENGLEQRIRIEYRAGPNDAWTTVAERLVSDPRGYFTERVPGGRVGEYRFHWIRPGTASRAPGTRAAVSPPVALPDI